MRIRSVATGAVLCAVSMTHAAARAHPAAVHAGKTLGAADQNAVAHFNVYLPLTHTDALEKLLQAQTDSTSPSYHHWLTPAQFKQQFGPNPADVARTRSLLQSEGFTIVSEKTQSLEVEGSVANAERIFNTRLNRVKMPKGNVKLAAAEGHINVPRALASMGAVIPEFTTHLRAHVHSQVLKRLNDASPAFRLSSNSSFFYPNDLNEAYQLPSFLTEAKPFGSHRRQQIVGLGVHIGIVISSSDRSRRSCQYLQLDLAVIRRREPHSSVLGQYRSARAHRAVPPRRGRRRPVRSEYGGWRGGLARHANVLGHGARRQRDCLRHAGAHRRCHHRRLHRGGRGQRRRRGQLILRRMRAGFHPGLQRRRRLHQHLEDLPRAVPARQCAGHHLPGQFRRRGRRALRLEVLRQQSAQRHQVRARRRESGVRPERHRRRRHESADLGNPGRG